MSTAAFADTRSAGAAYADLGWPIFPCHTKNGKGCTCGGKKKCSPAKHPRTTNGFLDATIDREIIERWATSYPLNWGMATGATAGVFALDVDPRHGGDKSLAELEARHGALPDTIEAITGGGGRHLIFRHPGTEISNREGGKSGIPKGLDIRGDGGYIILAPAAHIDGGFYRWREGHAPNEIEAADAPAWLLEMISVADTPPPRHEGNGHAESSDIDLLMRVAGAYMLKAGPADEGHRNGSAFNLAGHLAAFVVEDTGSRLSEAQALDLLRGWNHRNNPPLDDSELADACESAFSGNGKPRPDKVVKRHRTRSEIRGGNTVENTTHPVVASVLWPEGRTDTANARRYTIRYGQTVRWCDTWKKWLVWDGTRWAPDVTRAAVAHGKTIYRAMLTEIGAPNDE